MNHISHRPKYYTQSPAVQDALICPARAGLWLHRHGLRFTIKPWASRGISATFELSWAEVHVDVQSFLECLNVLIWKLVSGWVGPSKQANKQTSKLWIAPIKASFFHTNRGQISLMPVDTAKRYHGPGRIAISFVWGITAWVVVNLLVQENDSLATYKLWKAFVSPLFHTVDFVWLLQHFNPWKKGFLKIDITWS